jgi:hypothetical protein
MTIQITRPELEALINRRLQSGTFKDAEEVILQALQSSEPVEPAQNTSIFEQGLGLFGSPEDAALLDEVVSIAYQERRRPTKPPAL